MKSTFVMISIVFGLAFAGITLAKADEGDNACGEDPTAPGCVPVFIPGQTIPLDTPGVVGGVYPDGSGTTCGLIVKNDKVITCGAGF